jgi:hypothetical protein
VSVWLPDPQLACMCSAQHFNTCASSTQFTVILYPTELSSRTTGVYLKSQKQHGNAFWTDSRDHQARSGPPCEFLQQGKRQEAHDLLAPLHGWCSEGFDTADLQDANALLHALTQQG